MKIFLIFLFSLIPLLWLRGSEVILGHDSGFRLNYVEHLTNLLFSWHQNTNFGIDWSLYHGFVPIQAIETMMSVLTGSLSWGERLTFVYWFLVIGVSMCAFSRYFFSENKFLVLRIIAPIFYMYNFYLLNAWTIAERAKFSLYIALPLMIVLFFKTMRKELSLLRGGIYFGLLFFLFNGGGSPPLYGGILVTFGLLIVYFLFLSLKDNWFRLVQIIGVFGLCFILFNAYWLLPQMRLFSGSYAGAVSARGGVEGLIAWEREISKYASIPNILRLQGFPDWYNNPQHPYANTYLTNPFFIAISFLPVTVIVFGFLFLRRSIQKKDREILLFLGILAVVGLFFTVGSHAPFGVFYTYFMRHVPGFAIFRSSFYKFAPTVYLPIIVFFGYFLSLFISRFVKRSVVPVVVSVGLSLGIVLYHFPYLTGSFFALKDGFSTRLSIPPYVADMAVILAGKTHATDRILLIPPLDAGFINSPIDTYEWGFYSLDVLPRSIVNRSFVANDSNDDSITRLLYQSLKEGDGDTFLRVAQISGITHILWRGDVRLSAGTTQDLSQIGLFRLVGEAGKWKLYAIGLGVAAPMVYGASDVTLTSDNSPDDAYIVGKVLTGLTPVVLRVGSSEDLPQLSPKERFVEAECFLCKTNEYSKLVEAITLPLPKSSRLPFLKDRQTKQIEKTIAAVLGTPQEVDARLSAATLALSQKNMEPYRDHVRRIVEVLNILTGREKDYYANRVLAYLDAHIRDTEGQQDQVVITDFRKKIALLAWKAEGNTYRFGFTLPVEGIYSVWLYTPGVYNQSFTLDGKEYPPGKAVKLAPGYHRLLLTATNIENTADVIASPVFLRETLPAKEAAVSPGISFSQKNPTRYEVTVTDAAAPYVLVLNQRFDPGWGLSIDGIRQDYYHLQANGFANSWIVPKTGTYTLSLYYIPQQQANLGAIISGSTLLATLGYFVLSARKKRKS